MKRFFPWLVVIVGMLIAIPILIFTGYIGAARVLGVLVVLIFSVAVRLWLLRSDKMKKKFGKVTFNSNDTFHLQRIFPAWKTLSGALKKEMTRKMSKVIVGNVFDNYDHTSPSRDDITTVALALTLIGSQVQNKVIVMHREENPRSKGQKEIVFVNISRIEHLFVERSQWPLPNDFLDAVRAAVEKM